MSDDERATRGTMLKRMGHASIGIEMALSVAIAWWIGSELDEYLGTSWLTLTFVLLGVVAGFRSMFRLARRLAREDEAADAAATDDTEVGKDQEGHGG